MGSCKRCGSYAINHDSHGRDGTQKNLCDVCFWRNKFEKAEKKITRLLRILEENNNAK